MDRPVTILGGGVAGLAVALALVRRGVAAQVLEQADAITEVGAGLQISPNGAAVLRVLGLGQALSDIGTLAEAVELRDWSGRLVTRLDLAKPRPDQSYHFLHRADLVGMLERRCGRRGCRSGWARASRRYAFRAMRRC